MKAYFAISKYLNIHETARKYSTKIETGSVKTESYFEVCGSSGMNYTRIN